MLLNIRETVRKLQGYNNSPFPILSTYLPVVHGNDMVKKFDYLLNTKIPDHKRVLIEKDIQYTRAFLSDFQSAHKYKGIAIFSGGDSLWEVITTMFELPDGISLDYSPHLIPINEKLEIYNRYLIILSDRKKTRMYTLYLGAIENKEEFSDDNVPQKVRAQGSPELAKNIDRHITDHLHRHFDTVGKRAKAFVERKPLAGVIVGGHKESLPVLEQHLPKSLQEKIIGEFLADTDMNTNSLLAKSKVFITKSQNARNRQM